MRMCASHRKSKKHSICDDQGKAGSAQVGATHRLHAGRERLASFITMGIITTILYICGGCTILYILVNMFLLPDKPLRQGMYAEPGGRWYTLKWMLMYCLLKLRHMKGRKTADGGKPVVSGEVVGGNTPGGVVSGKGFGIRSHDVEEDLERCSELTDNPISHNSVYMFGINPVDGTWIGLRIAKRQNNMREVWFNLQLPGIGNVVLPEHPNTVVQCTTETNPSIFEGSGLTIQLVEPFKTWSITYNGQCRVGFRENYSDHDEREVVEVSCSLQWTACSPYVNFETDINPRLMAENIAKEKWTRTFFDNLKSLHQTHYEQFGELNGTVNIQGYPERTVCAKGIRDRSIGPRKWDDFYSYCLIFAVFEDGTFLHVGAFCFPTSLSHLNSGFLISKIGAKVAMVSSGLSLPDVMPDNNPPQAFSFSCIMEGGTEYTISAHIESSITLLPDNTGDIRLQEGKATFNMNGIPGYGICECVTSKRTSQL